MSVSLLSRKLRKKATHKQHYNWWFLLALPAWVTVSYFAAQLLLVAVFWLLNLTGFALKDWVSQTVVEVLLAGLVYTLTLAIVVGIPYAVKKRPTTLETLGLQKLLSWTDIGLAPLGYIVYALLLGITIATLMYIMPSFPFDQAQDVGFQGMSRQHEYTLAFLTLVVLAPIAEEALFRGYLYGKLKKHVPLYAAMLATAGLFALAHGQWNVAIDTFILSLVLTGLREITGTIWAGVLVHMIKNAIAFYVLFVAPNIIGV